MHKLIELRDTLVTELEEYSGKDQLDMSSLDIIDKLAHAIKNIDKVINSDCCDDYSSSQNGGYDYYDRGTYAKRGRMSGLRQRDNDYRRYSDNGRDDQQSRNDMMRNQRYE